MSVAYYWRCDDCDVAARYSFDSMERAEIDASFHSNGSGHQVAMVNHSYEPIATTRFYWKCDTCSLATGQDIVGAYAFETMEQAQANAAYQRNHAGHQIAMVHDANYLVLPEGIPEPAPAVQHQQQPPPQYDPYDHGEPELPMQENDPRSADVMRLQDFLGRLGYYPGEIDGWYGPITTAAVSYLQRVHHFEDTGVVDSATWQAIVRSL